MHRFLIDRGAIENGIALLDENEARHALKVLRLTDGDGIEAMDGQGSAWRGILTLREGRAYIMLGAELKSTDAPIRLTLYMGLPKGEKLEIVAQKLCELGAARLVPVRMERCIAKMPPQEAEKKLQRIRRIALEAQKQSGRMSELEVENPVDMKTLIDSVGDHEAAFLFWENVRGYRLVQAKSERPEIRNIAAIVGPEGGISDCEAAALVSAGALAVSLGPRILRAETAAIAACAGIMTLWGDL